MSKYGMTITVLATTLAEAVSKDEEPDQGGFDLSAGLFGEHVSEWLRDVAKHLSSEKIKELNELIDTKDRQIKLLKDKLNEANQTISGHLSGRY